MALRCTQILREAPKLLSVTMIRSPIGSNPKVHGMASGCVNVRVIGLKIRILRLARLRCGLRSTHVAAL